MSLRHTHTKKITYHLSQWQNIYITTKRYIFVCDTKSFVLSTYVTSLCPTPTHNDLDIRMCFQENFFKKKTWVRFAYICCSYSPSPVSLNKHIISHILGFTLKKVNTKVYDGGSRRAAFLRVLRESAKNLTSSTYRPLMESKGTTATTDHPVVFKFYI